MREYRCEETHKSYAAETLYPVKVGSRPIAVITSIEYDEENYKSLGNPKQTMSY
jgi:hypothetical protein